MKIKQRNNQIMIVLLAVIMVMAMMPSMVFATNFSVDHDRISIGAGEGLTLTWPSDSANTATAVSLNENYTPNQFTLWVQDSSVPTITTGSGSVQVAYTTVEDNVAYNVTTSTAVTIRVALNNASENNGIYYVQVPAPHGTKPTAGTPTAVNGYLPVGQFARGTAWGSIFSDGTNQSGTTKKLIGGYSTTGVSLGAAGGYVDFDLRVSNTSTNPYGVDFIVYGNAFNGNPEAGSVKVYGFKGTTDTDGKWYELAGSLYYDDLTQRNKAVSYKKVSTGDNAGIYYQITDNGVAPTDGGWKKFNTDTAVTWWPEDDEGYNTVWGPVDDVVKTDNIITYKGVSIVKDTDTTNDYQFGYADIHVNGSNYGTAINPYEATNTSQGGDGFDLSWAVDENGKPVVLDHITKVRVYTSAAMKTDGSGEFTVPSIFGETSAEVCGVYGVNGTGTGVATKLPTVKKGTSSYDHSYLKPTPIEVSGSITLKFSSEAGNMYVNNEKITSGTSKTFTVATGKTKYVRVITQTGTESPYITLFELKG